MPNVILPVARATNFSQVLIFQPRNNHEFFLYLLDVYAMKLDETEKLAVSLKLAALMVARDLDIAIPGILKGWTHFSLCFLVYLHVLPNRPPLSVEDLRWAKRSLICVTENLTSLSECLITLHALALKWHTLPPSPHADTYLQHVWSVARRICLFTNSADVLDVVALRYGVGTKFRVHPRAVMLFASRFRAFRRQVLAVSSESKWFYFEKWAKAQATQLRVRSFRAKLMNSVWRAMLLPGDCQLAKGRPHGVLRALAPPTLLVGQHKLVMYSSYDHMLTRPLIRDCMWIEFVCFFLGSLDLEWKRYCFCPSEHRHRHINRLKNIPIPIVVQCNHRFQTYFLNVPYGEPSDFVTAFCVWCTIVKEQCSGICYGVDVQSFCAAILDETTLVASDELELEPT